MAFKCWPVAERRASRRCPPGLAFVQILGSVPRCAAWGAGMGESLSALPDVDSISACRCNSLDPWGREFPTWGMLSAAEGTVRITRCCRASDCGPWKASLLTFSFKSSVNFSLPGHLLVRLIRMMAIVNSRYTQAEQTNYLHCLLGSGYDHDSRDDIQCRKY